MSIWYTLCEVLPIEMLRWDFMKNALLAILLMAPLFGLLSTMIVTGRMSFFSDALGHSAFTGIAIGCICGIAAPIWMAVVCSVFAYPVKDIHDIFYNAELCKCGIGGVVGTISRVLRCRRC